MRVFLLSLVWLSISTSLGFGQQAKAIKPTLMVMPADTWCYKNGAWTVENFDGQTLE